MKILSLDQSFKDMGICIGVVKKNQLVITRMETANFKQKTHQYWHLTNYIRELIEKEKPDLVLYENMYSGVMYQITGAVLAGIPPGTKYQKVHVKSCRAKLFPKFKHDKATAYELAIKRFELEDGICNGQVDALVQLVSQYSEKKVVFR